MLLHTQGSTPTNHTEASRIVLSLLCHMVRPSVTKRPVDGLYNFLESQSIANSGVEEQRWLTVLPATCASAVQPSVNRVIMAPALSSLQLPGAREFNIFRLFRLCLCAKLVFHPPARQWEWLMSTADGCLERLVTHVSGIFWVIPGMGDHLQTELAKAIRPKPHPAEMA